MNKNRFIPYAFEKIRENKDVISLTISSAILVHALLFAVLDENIKRIVIEYYYMIFVPIVLFLLIIWGGSLLYFHSDLLLNSYNEFTNEDLSKCSRRNSLKVNREEYQRKMQIFHLSNLEDIERAIKDDDQIWVLTSDVKLETTISTISDIMVSNLNRGVNYKYYIPDTVKNSASILELKRRYGKYTNFQLIKIDTKYKLLFERFDVIIYAPDKNYTEGRVGFICVNFSNINSSIAFKRISEEDIRNLIGILQQIGGV